MRIKQSRSSKSSSSSSSSTIKKFIKKFNFKRPIKSRINNNNFCCHNYKSSNFLCISQLEPQYKLFIEQVLRNLLALQESNKKATQTSQNHIAVVESEEKSFSSYSSQSSSKSSSHHFKENLGECSSKFKIDSLRSLKKIDRFSSVLFTRLPQTLLSQESPTPSDLSLNYLSRIEVFGQEPNSQSKQQKMSNKHEKEAEMRQKVETYKKFIEPVQAEMIPSWSSMEDNEKLGIVDLLDKWQISIHKKFQNLPQHEKQKEMMAVALNESRMIKKGSFCFDLNRNYLEKNQMELLDLSKFEPKSVKSEHQLSSKSLSSIVINKNLQFDQQLSLVRPNTRLILKSFKQFIEAFECLSQARQVKHDEKNKDLKLYWINLNKFILHMSKGILRCCFYVYENGDLKRNAVTLPPIYVLESDECEPTASEGMKTSSPNVKLEFLYEYVYICRSFLKQKLKKIHINEENDDQKIQRSILNNYKLILNCLIRLIQISALIRENLVMKRINYDDMNVCDIDIHSHFMSNECRLIREYLKKILEISSRGQMTTNHNQ